MTAAERNEDQFAILRRTMVEQVALHAGHVGGRTGRGEIAGPVLEAIGRVPRHAFVPVEMALYAYVDSPLPIGRGKTISQPFIVALMTDLLDIGAEDRVLEIGTGLGYQAALLAELAAEVFTVEVIEELGKSGRRRLGEQGYGNIASASATAAWAGPSMPPSTVSSRPRPPTSSRPPCCSSSSRAGGW